MLFLNRNQPLRIKTAAVTKYQKMASARIVKPAVKYAKPLLSLDRSESRRRVLELYKAWWRQIPYIVMEFDIPKNVDQCRKKLREEFVKHQHVNDIRVIDMLVIKGQMELQECVKGWKQKGHIMNYWKDTQQAKPTDFLSTFFSGRN